MKQMYYSEILNKYFETEEKCLKAETEFNEKHALEIKKKEERAARAKEVEDAFKEVIKAREHYVELKNNFINDYGSFHMTYTDKEPKSTILLDLLDNFPWFNAL